MSDHEIKSAVYNPSTFMYLSKQEKYPIPTIYLQKEPKFQKINSLTIFINSIQKKKQIS